MTVINIYLQNDSNDIMNRYLVFYSRPIGYDHVYQLRELVLFGVARWGHFSFPVIKHSAQSLHQTSTACTGYDSWPNEVVLLIILHDGPHFIQ